MSIPTLMGIRSVDYPTNYYLSGSHPDGGSSTPCEINFASPFTGYTYAVGSTSSQYRLDGGAWVSLSSNNYYWHKVFLNGVSKVEVQSANQVSLVA